jgi:hypothetical protein
MELIVEFDAQGESWDDSPDQPAGSSEERTPRALLAQINFGPGRQPIRLPVPKDRWGEILDAVGHRVETAPLDHD